jgi:hypothetical protein
MRQNPPRVSFCQGESNLVPGDTWVDKLKYAFCESDPNGAGYLPIDNWMQSRLRQVILKEAISDEQWSAFFQQIEANDDQLISWNELLDYLMCQQRSLAAVAFDKKVRLVPVAPDLASTHSFRRTTRCLRVRYIHFLEEIASLTQSSLRFWTLKCELARQFKDAGNFVDFCCIQSLWKLAIARENRSIIFSDLRTHTKLPFFSVGDDRGGHNSSAIVP